MCDSDSTLPDSSGQVWCELPPLRAGSSDAAGGGLTIREQVAAGLPVREGKTALKCEGNGRPWLRAVDHVDRRVFLYRPNCGSWGCPYCAERNKRHWMWKIATSTAGHLEAGREVSFTSVTSHERLRAGASLEVFKSAWPKLRKRADVAAPGGEYVLIPERHQSGRLHCHVLDTWNLPTRWWKDNARECGLGYQADSQFARTAGGAARYAAKYLAKGLGTSWPKGFRRVRVSKGFLMLPEDGGELVGWSFCRLPVDADLSDQLNYWRGLGFVAQVVDACDLQEELRKGGEESEAEAWAE